MKIISVINYKGGVGKTTIVANLAAYMAIQGQRVLMLDLDPQASLTFSFLEPKLWEEKYRDLGLTMKDAIDSFISNGKGTDLQKYIVSLAYANEMVEEEATYGNNGSLSMVCSNLNLLDADLDLAGKLATKKYKLKFKAPIVNIMGHELCYTKELTSSTENFYEENYIYLHTFLLNMLKTIKKSGKYDVVLIDCPPNIGILNRNALLASDFYLIPAKPEFLSIYGIPNMNEQITKIVNKIIKMQKKCIENNCHDEIITATLNKPKLLGVLFNMVKLRQEDPIHAHQGMIERLKKFPESRNLKFIKQVLRLNNAFADMETESDRIPLILRQKGLNNDIRIIKKEIYELGKEFMKECGIYYER